MAFGDNANILQTINVHTSDVTTCDFTSNFVLITGSSDKTVRLWEWIPGNGYQQKSISPFLGHKYGVTCVRVSPQSTMLATTSIDGTAILWNIHSGTKIYTMVQDSGDAIRVCRFAPDSTILVTGGDNGAVCVWDLIHRSLIKTIFQHEGSTQALAFTPDSQYLVSACSLEVIRIWSTQDLVDTTNDGHCTSLVHVDNAHDLGILSADISNKINSEEDDPLTKHYTLATSGNTDKIKLWTITSKVMAKHETSTNRVVIEYRESYCGHASAVTCVKFNYTGTLLVSASLDKTIKLWDTSGNCVANLLGHTRYLNTVTISKDSILAASGSTGSNDKSVVIWDLFGNLTKDSVLVKSYIALGSLLNRSGVQEMQVVRSAEADDCCKLIEKVDDIAEAAINTCCFYGDNMLATGSSDKLIRLFRVHEDTQSLEEMNNSPIDGHSYIINQVHFSYDGSKLATCSLDGCAYIWNPLTGEKLSSVPENYLSLRVACFSPSGSSLIVAGDDEKATIWDVDTLNKKFTLEGHTDAITSASFSPDSNLIATTCNNGDFRIWREDTCIYVQDDAHDLGIQSSDFSQNSDPIPNQVLNDSENYLLATCGNDSFVKLWWISIPKKDKDIHFTKVTIKQWRLLRGHGGSVINVRFSPSTGEIVCSTGTDRQARIWSVYSGDCIHVLDHDSITTCCSFSKSCTVLAIGCMDKTLWLWKLPMQLVFQTVVANKFKARNKAVADWTTSDVVKWLNDVGLNDIGEVVAHTSLDGRKILTIPEEKICSGLDLDEDHSVKLSKEIKWLKGDQLQLHIKSTSAEEVPFEYLCPITHEIMLEPVTCSDGYTYERKAITEWFLSGKFSSPMTNETLSNTEYKSNVELRNKIHTFLYSDEP